MKVFYCLISLVLLTSSSAQNVAIVFPGEDGNNVDDKVRDEGNNIDDNEPDDSYEYEDFGEYEDYGEYEEDPYAELETFGYEGDYIELPAWMDTDLNELSLEKLAILNSVTEFTELSGLFEVDLDAFLFLPNRTQPNLSVDSRSGTPAPLVEKKVQKANFAKCTPEKVTVELPVAKGSSYLPSCVRLMRCGGCCNSKLLSCQPTKVENITLMAMKISKGKKRNNSRPRRRRRTSRGKKVTMAMEDHLECKCDCKVQEKDCEPSTHIYNKDACACECKNGGEEMECQKSKQHKWDKNLCQCMCRKQKECSTGELYSQRSCKCVTMDRLA